LARLIPFSRYFWKRAGFRVAELQFDGAQFLQTRIANFKRYFFGIYLAI